MRQIEQLQEERHIKSQAWVPKKSDEDSKVSADVNMVVMLPKEFMAPADDQDISETDEEATQFNWDPVQAIFDKPDEKKCQHLKALFLKGHVDGKPMTKMLIDGGASVNIMPYAMLRKIGKGEENLNKNDLTLKDFEGKVSLLELIHLINSLTDLSWLETLTSTRHFCTREHKGEY